MSQDVLGSVVRALVKVPLESLRTVMDFIHKVTGSDSTLWLAEAPKFLRGETCWIVKRVLKPWKTIRVGGTTKDQLIAYIEAMPNAEMSTNAKGVMGEDACRVASEVSSVDLIIMAPCQFGLTDRPGTDKFLTKKFCDKWSADNLKGQIIELCQAEDGPQLLKQYPEQPNGELLWMAMEPICFDDVLRVFRVECGDDGKRHLSTYFAGPRDKFSLVDLVVFRLRTLPL